MLNLNRVRLLTVALGVLVAPLSVAGPINPDFEEGSPGAIAEFRSNGNGTSWSAGTGQNTQITAQSTNDTGNDVEWVAGDPFDWDFSVTGGVPTLTVGGNTLSFTDGLTSDQLGMNTLAIHAKAGVEFTFDFGAVGAGTLAGDTGNRFGVDWAYLALPTGIDGLSGSGTITFLDPIGNQSASGVTFKLGNLTRQVPEPGTLTLLGAGLLGLVLGLRRRSA